MEDCEEASSSAVRENANADIHDSRCLNSCRLSVECRRDSMASAHSDERSYFRLTSFEAKILKPGSTRCAQMKGMTTDERSLRRFW